MSVSLSFQGDGLDLYDDSNLIGTTSISGSTKYFPDESPLADESADAGNRVTLADDTIHDVELEQMVRDKVLQKMLRKTDVRVDQVLVCVAIVPSVCGRVLLQC